MTREEFINWFEERIVLTKNDIYECGQLYDEVTKPHWISVEKELPPRFKLVPNVSVNVLTYGLHTMVNWYDYERGEWAIDSEITHWMPLPQAPKKGGEA